MKVTYTLNDADIKKFMSSDFRTKKNTILKIILVVTFIILTLILLISLIAKDYLFSTPLFLFLLFVSIILYYPKVLKKKYIKNLNTDNKKAIELKEGVLVVSSSDRKTSYNYTDIKKVNFVNDYFVLIEFKPGDSIVIPKSAFNDNLEITTFINLLKTNAHIL